MTSHLTPADLARISRNGFTPLTSAQATALLDAACTNGSPHLLAASFDPRPLAAQPPQAVPAILRTLVTTTASRNRPAAAATSHTPADLARRLAAMPEPERHTTLLNLINSQAAVVLGHRDLGAMRVGTSFKDLGFDSLTAVELRNRLAAATGLRLPAAVVFDYPHAAVLADYLLNRLAPNGATAPLTDAVEPVLGDLGRIESVLGALALDQAARERVTHRLRGLLASLGGEWATPTTAAAVEAASDEEMFALIDKQLGSPAMGNED